MISTQAQAKNRRNSNISVSQINTEAAIIALSAVPGGSRRAAVRFDPKRARATSSSYFGKTASGDRLSFKKSSTLPRLLNLI